jgi:hypothetical protein
MTRSRIALIHRAMDVVFGDTRGSHGESGWAQGVWTKRTGHGKVTVCLNSALFAAERDVYGLDTGGAGDGNVPVTDEGKDTQQLLADTIVEMYPDHFTDGVPDAQFAIIKFNDEIAGSDDKKAADEMEAVLRKCENKAYDKWLEDHPQMGGTPDQSFIDYALEGNVS